MHDGQELSPAIGSFLAIHLNTLALAATWK
jgi:hypothetical protein